MLKFVRLGYWLMLAWLRMGWAAWTWQNFIFAGLVHIIMLKIELFELSCGLG